MANIQSAFDVEHGISIDNLVGVFAGQSDPSVSGEPAPLGSIFIQSSGALFQKTGAADNGWTRLAAAGSGADQLVKISAGDAAAGLLADKLVAGSALAASTAVDGTGSQTLTLALATVGTAGTWTQVTTNEFGQITSGVNPGFITGNQTITLSGDVTGAGTTGIATTLADTGVVAGSYSNPIIHVDSKGRVTTITSGLAASGGLFLLYTADTQHHTAADPGEPYLRWNTAVLGSATEIYIDNVDDQAAPVGIDISAYLSTIIPNTVLWIQHRHDSTIYQRWLITSAQNMSGWFKFGVTLLDSANFNTGTISNNSDLAVQFSYTGAVQPVTEVGLSLPSSMFSIDNSPVTGTGTLSASLHSQAANSVLAAPAAGGVPSFRTLDLDALSDVSVSGASSGQVLQFNGSSWTAANLTGQQGAAALHCWSGNISATSGTSTIVPGAAAPLVSQGTQLAAVTVSPSSAGSHFIISVSIAGAASNNNDIHTLAVFRNSVYIGGAVHTFDSGGNSSTLAVTITDAPGTTADTVYSIRYGSNLHTWCVNRRTTEVTYGGLQSGYSILEY